MFPSRGMTVQRATGEVRSDVERQLPMSTHVNVHRTTSPAPHPQPECPECADERCRPLAVTSRVGGVTVRYRCEGCGHEWSVDQSRTPLFGSAR